jgi:carbonic anhydrase
MNKMVLTCMDRRLWPVIDKEIGSSKEGAVTVVRNAGANLKGVESSVDLVIKEHHAREIDIFPHTNCGACNVVYNACLHNINVSESVEDALVRQFTSRKSSFLSPDEVESVNITIQKEALQKFEHRGIATHVECIDVKSLNVPKDDGEHVLVIGKPYSGKYEDLAGKLGVNPWSMYCLNAESIIEVMPDIEIAAINLGIKNFKIVSLEQSNHRWATQEEKILRIMPFMRGIKTEVVKLG